MKKFTLLSTSLILFCLVHCADASVLRFWDINGTNSIGGNGTWNTTKEFSTTSNQVDTTALVAWNDANANIAVFSAGPVSSGSQGALTITVNRTNVCAGLDNGNDGPGSCFLTIVGGASGMLSMSGTINTAGATEGSTSIGVPLIGTNQITFAGSWHCFLSATNTYSGNTVISGGTVALGTNGSISNTAQISIAGGATFDVSAVTNFSLSSSNTIKATGSTLPATIIGGSTVNFGSQSILLTTDGTHPSLTISQGTLSLNGNAFTVNKSIPLTAGDHTIIQQTSGSITSSGSYSVTGTAIPAGAAASISVSVGNVILTVTNIPTTTTLGPVTNSTYGQSVTLTATVAPTPSGGTVQFYDNAVALGDPAPVSGGTASLTTNGLSIGTHPITASYGGTAGYLASPTSASSNQVVSLPPNSAPVTITNTSLLNDGSLQMYFVGIPGYTYLIQATASLNSPITWSNLSTNMADTNGLFNFNDPGAVTNGDRYYRTEVQP